ncbi:haloalkane dehalogenase [Streptomyces sp. NPDC052225]|uniref:haloalkane dehalogenase n=1 Tax=Streptomyces sp. NPDC052225 TaxID=3154949 RepID=UPI00342D9855
MSTSTSTSTRTVPVLDSFMAYVDEAAGSASGGPVVVFLHGNPTSSHLWRNVTPHVAGQAARVLVPDLIGMGASGKPDIGYRFADHARYLEAWLDAAGVDDAVFVGHDWGGALAMDFAARHPGRVRGLALVETFLRPLAWAELPPLGQELFRDFRTPGKGEEMILRDNMFIEFNLPHGIDRLSAEDHDVYRAPYPTEASRKPLLVWPREIPFDGEPADVHARMVAYGDWLGSAESAGVPKLVMHAENGFGMGSSEAMEWVRATFTNAETVNIGVAGHHAPEDQPDAIGAAVSDWLARTMAS